MSSGLLLGCGNSSPPPDGTPTTTPPTTPSGDVGPEVGKTAPDFTLTDLDGKTVTLSGLRGKPVLINFWATWCVPCFEEMPYFQTVYDTWTDKGLTFLSISTGESATRVSGYLQTNGFKFPVLVDNKGNVALKYGIMYLPTTIIIDKDGIIKLFKIAAFSGLSELEGEIKLNIPEFQ